MNLSLEKNEDILKHVSDNNPDLKIVGFAAETENMIDNARKKLSSKNLNLIVANDVSDSSIGFDSNNNEVTLITEKEELKIPKTSKEKVARKIVQFISKTSLMIRWILLKLVGIFLPSLISKVLVPDKNNLKYRTQR